MTSSADKSLKIWDMASRTLVRTIPVGTAIGDMQNSVAWSPAGIVSLALDGTLRFFDPDGGDAPTRAVYGHQQAITAMAFDSATGRLFTTCAAGRMCVWHPTTEAGDSFEAAISGGEQHSKKAIAVAVAGSEAVSASWDRKLRVVDTMSGECTAVIAADCEPRALVASATNPEMRIAASNSAIKVFLGATQASETAAPWSPTCLSLSANGTLLAVGGEDKRVHFFAVAADGSLTAAGESPECAGAVSTVAVSPDNVTVAAGDALREVALFNSSTKERVTPSRWQSHTTRVTAIAWRPSGSHLVSVSTDRRLCIWDPSSPAPAKKTDCTCGRQRGGWLVGRLGVVDPSRRGVGGLFLQWPTRCRSRASRGKTKTRSGRAGQTACCVVGPWSCEVVQHESAPLPTSNDALLGQNGQSREEEKHKKQCMCTRVRLKTAGTTAA